MYKYPDEWLTGDVEGWTLMSLEENYTRELERRSLAEIVITKETSDTPGWRASIPSVSCLHCTFVDSLRICAPQTHTFLWGQV